MIMAGSRTLGSYTSAVALMSTAKHGRTDPDRHLNQETEIKCGSQTKENRGPQVGYGEDSETPHEAGPMHGTCAVQDETSSIAAKRA